jgi:hypothetical protein
MPATQKPIEHGTIRGYRSHLRKDIPVCIACRIAWNDYHRRQAEARKHNGNRNTQN